MPTSKMFFLFPFLLVVSSVVYSTQAYTEKELIALAREKAEDADISVWKIVAESEERTNLRGESAQEVAIFSIPREVDENLCKSFLYSYNVRLASGQAHWDLADIDGRGFSTFMVSVLKEGHRADCSFLELDDFFEVRDPIEDSTLKQLYAFIVDKLESGNMPSASGEQARLRSIYLSLKPGSGGSYKYRASIESTMPRGLYSIDIELDDASFKLVD